MNSDVYVRATINFILTGGSTFASGDYLQFSIDNNFLSTDTNNPPAIQFSHKTFIADGIPGESTDHAFRALQAYNTRYYQAPQLNLLDPSGEFIGPNGDGDPNDIHIYI
jgi:hypothetical protein